MGLVPYPIEFFDPSEEDVGNCHGSVDVPYAFDAVVGSTLKEMITWWW